MQLIHFHSQFEPGLNLNEFKPQSWVTYVLMICVLLNIANNFGRG